jgi:hypothetical protein
MRNSQSLVADDLASALDKLFLQFGSRRMVAALSAAAWRHLRAENSSPWRANDPTDLSDRMRRDIGIDGLPEAHPRPGSPEWERWR